MNLSENPDAHSLGYELCPRCEGQQWQGRSEKRRKACGWCGGRGFMFPRRSEVIAS